MKILIASINSKYIHTNLAIRYLKKYLEKNLPDQQYYLQEWTLKQNILEIIQNIYSINPDFLLLSVYIWNIELTLKIITEIKKLKPELTIVLGGPEVSYKAEFLLKTYPEINHIIKGEGELAAKLLLSGQTKDSIIEAPSITNLDEIPFAYEPSELANKILYYESSRGCPFSCVYCMSSLDKQIRYFSLDRVKTDLRFFLNNKVKLVKFVDRTFNLDPARYLKIWQFILDNHNGLTTFHFEIAADLLSAEALDLLQKAPPHTIQLEIGIQSTNTRTLEIIQRKTDLKKLRENFLKINKNVHTHVDLITGLPEENFQSFGQSLDYAVKLQPDYLQLGFLKILSGTRMEKIAQENHYRYLNSPPYEVLATPWLSTSEINQLKAIENVIDIYYNSEYFSEFKKLLWQKASPFDYLQKLTNYLTKTGILQDPRQKTVYAEALASYYNHCPYD